MPRVAESRGRRSPRASLRPPSRARERADADPPTPRLFFKFAGTPDQIKSDTARTRVIAQKYNGSKFTFSRNDREADGEPVSPRICLNFY